jgi:hypothetical protein
LPLQGLETSVSQLLEDVDSDLRRLALVYQHLHQERHNARIVDLLEIHQRVEFGHRRPG